MTPSPLAAEFVTYAAQKLEQQFGQVVRCAGLLSTAELWQRPNAHVNSVANLVLHLNGNVGQWIVSGLGGAPVSRDRTREFTASDGRPASELLPPFEQTVRAALAIIRGLDAESLAAPRTIQGYPVSTLAAVFHVVEHFCFHTGQIIHATKWLKDVDLSLYDAAGRRLGDVSGQP